MKRMYLLSQNNIPYSKPYVQAAHALAEFAKIHPKLFKEWGNSTLIFLSCESAEEEFHKIRHIENNCTPFYEPDYKNKLTAFAVYTIKDNMKQYKLIDL